MIKVKIGPQVKGELYIKVKNRTYKKGSFVSFTEDEFKDSFVQTMIQKGFLLIDASHLSSNYAKEDFVKIISCKKNPIVIPAINRAIGPNDEISVFKDILEDPSIQNAIENGYIKIVEDSKVEDSKVEVIKKDKKVKRIKDKTEQVDVEQKTNNNERTKAYIHKPEGARINNPPIEAKDDRLNDIFLDLDKNEDDILFVDIEQDKQRASELRRRIAKNNEEIQ